MAEFLVHLKLTYLIWFWSWKFGKGNFTSNPLLILTDYTWKYDFWPLATSSDLVRSLNCFDSLGGNGSKTIPILFLIVQIKGYIQGFQMRYQSFLGHWYPNSYSWFSNSVDILFVLINTEASIYPCLWFYYLPTIRWCPM